MNTTTNPELSGEEQKTATEFVAPTTGYAPEQAELPDQPASSELIEKVGQPWQEGSPEITWDQICFVRSLGTEGQLEVQQFDDGSSHLVAPTALSASSGEVMRDTVHWSINHKVTANNGGSWAESPYIIIAPGAGLKEKNGNPTSLEGVDTYWVGDTIIPENTVIIHTGEVPEEFQQIPGIKWVKQEVDLSLLAQNETLQLEWAQFKIEAARPDVDPVKREQTYRDLNDRQFKLNDELNKPSKEKASDIIDKMGYTTFRQNSGMQMNEEGLDDAIHGLRNKENILYAGLHSQQETKNIENATFFFNMREEARSIKSLSQSIRLIRGTVGRLQEAGDIEDADMNSLFQVWMENFHSYVKDNPDKFWQDEEAVSAFTELVANHKEMAQMFHGTFELRKDDPESASFIERVDESVEQYKKDNEAAEE